MQYIAFLRGINVGKRRVKMEQLCKFFGELKLEQVRWFIASGNILFVSRRRHSNLESIIESRLKEGLGYPVDTFVRTREELKEICAFDGLPEPKAAGASIQIGFMKQTLGVQVQRQLHAASTARDQVMVADRQLYWLCHDGISKSQFWKQPQVRRLTLPSMTIRNRTSLLKLLDGIAD